MARSMTGFGKSEFRNDRFELNVEVRNLNNRYLDIGLRFPKILAPYEFKVKDIIKSMVLRGKIMLSIVYKEIAGTDSALMINDEKLKSLKTGLTEICRKTGIEGPVTLDHLLFFKDLWVPEEEETDDSELEQALYQVVRESLDDLNKMRDQESENISPDIINRLDLIAASLNTIEDLARDNPRTELDRLHNRISELINKGDVDKDRLELELAIIADRVDVTEECIRLRSHIDMFRDIFITRDEVGKQLTFILQEMQRETNTIGSKTTITDISYQVIKIKEEIEKLREQVQNLE